MDGGNQIEIVEQTRAPYNIRLTKMQNKNKKVYREKDIEERVREKTYEEGIDEAIVNDNAR